MPLPTDNFNQFNVLSNAEYLMLPSLIYTVSTFSLNRAGILRKKSDKTLLESYYFSATGITIRCYITGQEAQRVSPVATHRLLCGVVCLH